MLMVKYEYFFFTFVLCPIVLSDPLSTEIFVQRGISTLLVSFTQFTKRMYTDIDLVMDKTRYSQNYLNQMDLEGFTNKGSGKMVIDDVEYSFDILEGIYRITDSNNKDIATIPFSFLYLNREGFRSDSISFAYNIKEEFSIIHQLYNRKYINRRAFAFSEGIITNKIKLYYGELPQKSIYNKAKLTCKVNNKYSTWGCDIHSIYFSNPSIKYQKSNQYVYFQTNIEYILAPEDFLTFLHNTIFISYFNSGLCFYDIDANEAKIVCNEYISDQFPKIYIRFDTGTFVIENIMRKYYNGFYSCIFEANYIDKGTKNKWIFGNYFLLFFSEVFDYDSSEITFYSDRHIITFNSYNQHLLILNIIILVIMIIILKLSQYK